MKFNGVRIKPAKLEKAVKLTESAIFPLANELIKLEIFPPGQDATNIIPSPIVSVI